MLYELFSLWNNRSASWSRGLDLMRQTLLLAGRLERQSKPLCQDAILSPLLLLSIRLPVWLQNTPVTPTCPSLFVFLSSGLSTLGLNHTTICPLPGSRPLRHGSWKCYSSVNLSRATGTPMLWHTPVLSQRSVERKYEGNFTVTELASPGSWSLQGEQDVRSKATNSSATKTLRTHGQTPTPPVSLSMCTCFTPCYSSTVFPFLHPHVWFLFLFCI